MVGGQKRSVLFGDDFEQLVKFGMGKISTNIRQDKNGIAIKKGSKMHKICFRDEVDIEEKTPKEPFAQKKISSAVPVSKKNLPSNEALICCDSFEILDLRAISSEQLKVDATTPTLFQMTTM